MPTCWVTREKWPCWKDEIWELTTLALVTVENKTCYLGTSLGKKYFSKNDFSRLQCFLGREGKSLFCFDPLFSSCSNAFSSAVNPHMSKLKARELWKCSSSELGGETCVRSSNTCPTSSSWKRVRPLTTWEVSAAGNRRGGKTRHEGES